MPRKKKEVTELATTKEAKVTKQEIILYELKKIEQRDGIVTPKAVVDEARSELSPLHDHFEWDDDKAAEGFRLFQARQLIRGVQVVIEDVKTEAYHNVVVTVRDVQARGYLPARTIFSDEVLVAQVIDMALVELERWQEKYKNYKQLSDVINGAAVTTVKKQLKKKIAKKI